MDKNIVLFDGLETSDKLSGRVFNTSIDVINSETGKVIFKGLKNKVVIPASGLIANKLFALDNKNEYIKPTYDDIIGLVNPATGTDAQYFDTIDSKNEVLLQDYKEEDQHIKYIAEKGDIEITESDHRVILFCCGIDGCGSQNSQVFPVDYKDWITPTNLIPFRFIPVSSYENGDIESSYDYPYGGLHYESRKKYFGLSKSVIDAGSANEAEYFAYYFKRFENIPTLVQQLVDGTTLTESNNSEIYRTIDGEGNIQLNGEASAESYVEMRLQITKQDLREYFAATQGIEYAKINSISLLTAYPVIARVKVDQQNTDNNVDTNNNDQADKRVEYRDLMFFKDVRPFTKLNFPNEQFIDDSKGIDIIYHIYL